MQFEFATAGRIIFGSGQLTETGALAKSFGARALLVTGRTPARAARLREILAAERIVCADFTIGGEPSVQEVLNGTALARESGSEWVIGFGGGSAIDAAKAIAALLANPGDPFDYLEVIGQGKPLAHPPVPWIAIPTTAGTGAEVTRNAVLSSPEHRVKVSLRSPAMLPRIALVDPELTLDMPPEVTANTGLDALTQLIEPYVSIRANPLTDGFCVEGMRRVARSLRRAYENGRDIQAREAMALASLLSGLALANAGLGVVHGFASPLGGMFGAPHGAICAAILPHAMEMNIQALQQRAPASESLARYTEVARILTGNAEASAEEGVEWVRELCADLAIASLGRHGVQPEHFADLSEKASKASSMKGNPIPLTPAELSEILSRSSAP
jgi:alcohol dehydrogenase class IV